MEQRFLEKIEKTKTCWIWKAGCIQDGYGVFVMNGKTRRAHRIAFELWKQPIPDGLLVRHKCDNRKCVNPNHLELGTHKDNTRDMIERGRVAQGEKQGIATLTDDEVREIKILLNFGFNGVELGKMYNVNKAVISRIRLNKTWKHISTESLSPT